MEEFLNFSNRLKAEEAFANLIDYADKARKRQKTWRPNKTVLQKESKIAKL